MGCLPNVTPNRITICAFVVASFLFCMTQAGNADETTPPTDTQQQDDSLQAYLDATAGYDTANPPSVEELYYSLYSDTAMQAYLNATAAYDNNNPPSIWDLYMLIFSDQSMQAYLDATADYSSN